MSGLNIMTEYGMIHLPHDLIMAQQEFQDLQDWEILQARVAAGDPKALEFAEKMVTQKKVSSKMMKKFEKELIPLACFYVKVKKIWFANQCVKSRYGPEPATPPCLHPWCEKVENLLKHLFTCDLRENCPVPDCFDTFKIVEHLVHCADRQHCFLCFPMANEVVFHADMLGLISPKIPLTPGTDMYYAHYNQLHFYALAYNKHIWKLVLLDIMHGYFCANADDERCKCELEPCYEYRKQLKHVKDCKKAADCDDNRCFLVKRLIIHWNGCKDKQCPLCKDPREEYGLSIDLDAWDKGQVKQLEFPPLATDANLGNCMVKLNFTKHNVIVYYPNENDKKQPFKTVAYHLIMLHHAKSCTLTDCRVPVCPSMQALLAHIQVCRFPKSCKVTYCQKTRIIRDHWNWCTVMECSLCDVIRESKKRGKLIPPTTEVVGPRAIKL